jgi:hypothetical protein
MLLIMRVAEDLMALQGFGGCPMAKDDLTVCQQKSCCPILLPIKKTLI